MGFSIHGTPKEGDVKKVSGAMDDVLPAKPMQILSPPPKADGSLPTAADLLAFRDTLNGQA